MEALEKRLVVYLDSITGKMPDLQMELADGMAALPLFLRERYLLRALRIFGKKCLLALEAPEWETGSPSEYASHAELLHQKLGEPVTIVLPNIPSYVRNRMVQMGVPFIVPGNQLFMPFVMVDLREHFHRISPAHGKNLSPSTQSILLYHLLRESIAGVPLRSIAEKVGGSPMMLSRAKDELEAGGLCGTTRKGRSIVLEFNRHRRELWEQAQSFLTSPVRKTHWIQWSTVGYPALEAGLTALSSRTMIEDDRLPTYALPQETYRANLEKGIFHGCPGSSGADIQLQAWSYNPLLLGDEIRVDPLSLYLSLRDSVDERIQQQLETLIEEVNWS